jgi:magnesium transporter
MTTAVSSVTTPSDKVFRVSEIRKRPAYVGYKKIGRLQDLVIVDKDLVAEVTHVCIGRPFGLPTIYVPWKYVQSVSPERVVIQENADITPFERAPDNAVLLQDFIVDKKVLDVQGREVEIVYDVMLALIRIHLYVVAVDLSKQVMWKRMGMGWLGRLCAEGSANRILPWNVVEPLPENLGSFAGDIRLKLVKEELAKMPPTDAARILEELSHDQRLAIIEGMGTENASDTLEELDPKSQRDVIAAMRKDKAAKLIDEMTPGQGADVLSVLPYSQATAILRHMNRDMAARVREIMSKHDEEVIDYIVDDYIRLKPDDTVLEARQRCQAAKDRDAVAYLYVIDAAERLVGLIDTPDLLMAKDQMLVKDIMKTKVVTIDSEATLKEAAEAFNRYQYRALPVIDEDRKLLGVVPARDVLDLDHRYVS